VPDAGIALCYGCHRYLDSHKAELEALGRKRLGDARYEELERMSRTPEKVERTRRMTEPMSKSRMRRIVLQQPDAKTVLEKWREAREKRLRLLDPRPTIADLWDALAASQERVEALEELVHAERDLPLKIEPDYNDPDYAEKHERAKLAREAVDMPLPRDPRLAAPRRTSHE